MAYLTSKEVRQKLKDCSASTLWRWQQPTQKLFEKPLPPPVRNCVGSPSLWDKQQVEDWELQYFRNNTSLTA